MRPRRRYRAPVPTPAIVGASDDERIVWLLIGEAQAQIALTSGRSQGQEVKALGILGLDVGVIAALTAIRGALPAVWWIAVVALAACVPCLLATVASGRALYAGPNLAVIRSSSIGQRALDTGLSMLTDLLDCLDNNVRAQAPKARFFGIGLALFVAGLLFATAFLLRFALVQ